jgi:hypothetical protein
MNFQEKQEQILGIVDDLKVDDATSNKNYLLKIGNKVYNLVASEIQDINEDLIRKEMEESLEVKRNIIKEQIREQMNEVSLMVSSIKAEYDRKEKLLKERMATAVPMPDVRWEHARRGLSVVRGNGMGELIWLVKRTYNPKYLDFKPIESTYVKKMMTNIYIRILTRDDCVTLVSTHSMGTLDFFDHYHQRSPDCWGNWTIPSKWNTPDDIISIADAASAVLENINGMSLARRNPRHLPRIDTLRHHVINENVQAQQTNQAVRVSTTGLREGLGVNNDQDIWGN